VAEDRVPEDVEHVVSVVGQGEWVDYRVALYYDVGDV